MATAPKIEPLSLEVIAASMARLKEADRKCDATALHLQCVKAAHRPSQPNELGIAKARREHSEAVMEWSQEQAICRAEVLTYLHRHGIDSDALVRLIR